MLKINLYKNKVQGHKNFGKVYGRVENSKPIDIKGLAKHMLEHGTIVTEDVLVAVLTKASSCIRELALRGQPVKLGDLGIFKASVQSTPANDVESFSLDTNIVKVKILCQATGANLSKYVTEDATFGYTSMAQRVKTGEITLSSRKGEYIATDSGNGWGDEPVVNP